MVNQQGHAHAPSTTKRNACSTMHVTLQSLTYPVKEQTVFSYYVMLPLPCRILQAFLSGISFVLDAWVWPCRFTVSP